MHVEDLNDKEDVVSPLNLQSKLEQDEERILRDLNRENPRHYFVLFTCTLDDLILMFLWI